MTLVRTGERRLQIPADELHLPEVREFVTEIASSLGYEAKDINSIKLAVEEGCTNIIRHAYRDVPGGTIDILAIVKPRSLSYVLIDHGKGFDFRRASDPNLQTYMKIGKRGGLGIFLMKKLMDEVEYHVTTRGNELWLTKNRPLQDRRVWRIFPRRLSLRTKVTTLSSLAFSGIVLGVFWQLHESQATAIREEMLGQAVTQARTLARSAWPDLLAQNDLNLAALTRNLTANNSALLEAFVTDAEGTIWGHSTVARLFSTYRPPARQTYLRREDGLAVSLFALPGGGEIYQVSVPVAIGTQGASRPPLGGAHLRLRRAVVDEAIAASRQRTALWSFLLLLLGNAGIFALAHLLLRPFQKLASWVRGKEAATLEEGLQVDSDDEVGEIAEAFSDIARRFREAQSDLVESERLQQEVEVAQEIQQMLLPRTFPQVEGYDIKSIYSAATEVGGDYYDFVWVDEDTLGIVIADVSGKGVPGSLVMTMIRTALRLEARGNHSASDVLARINRFVADDIKKGMFVTMFYIILDSRQRVISFASAGHHPVILYRGTTKKSYYLNPEGFPVGIALDDTTLFEESIHSDFLRLAPGDLLIAYTDGITEAMNPERELFGEERFLEAIRRHGHLPVKDFVAALQAEISAFTRGHPQSDDITLVSIQESLRAGDVLFEVRQKLLRMVEEEGVPVKEACERMRVSPSTFYRYRRRWKEEGDQGLRNRREVTDVATRHIAIEDRAQIFDIIQHHPGFGVRRIIQELQQRHQTVLPESLLYQELRRLRLNTPELRREYARRGAQGTPQRVKRPGTPLLTIDGKVITERTLPATGPRPLPAPRPRREIGHPPALPTGAEAARQREREEVLRSLAPDLAHPAEPPRVPPVVPGIPLRRGPLLPAGPKAAPVPPRTPPRIPPRSPLWPGLAERMQAAAGALPVASPPSSLRTIPLAARGSQGAEDFLRKEIDRSLALGRRWIVLDLAGCSLRDGLHWIQITSLARHARRGGARLLVMNLADEDLALYRELELDRLVPHIRSTSEIPPEASPDEPAGPREGPDS